MIKRSVGEHVFDFANTLIMIFVIVTTLYPFWFVICASFSRNHILQQNPGILLYPKEFTTGAYKLTFDNPLLAIGYKNILLILLAALPLNLIMTLFCGYFMAMKDMLLKKFLVGMMLFTMFFGGGLVPTYLNMRSLGLYNNLWALIIPGAVSIYNSIIVKTAIEGIPDSLFESAYIDGANDFFVLFKIVLALIMPTLAVITLYYAVGHWNSWFPATIYITDDEKLPLQAILRAILITNTAQLNKEAVEMDQLNSYAETIKYSIIVVGTLPILISYPFLQKYFVKGVMIGAIKG
jgi:putative aldouronate transport system permease protein